MDRDELLTKLAMEVGPSYWPPSDTEYEFGGFVFGWNEYQMRRTELIKKPSWDDAPEWAEWLAQDSIGCWHWFESKPLAHYGQWDDLEREARISRIGFGTTPSGHGWRDTLEPRPQTQSDIKTCRHCDIEFRRPHVDGIPDDRCTRCDDEIKALWPEREPAKSWWTSKTCTQCGHATAAKVSDDKPVCPGCVALSYDEDSDAGSALGRALDEQQRGSVQDRSKYHREIKPGVWVDVYDVLRAWGVKNPALQHLIKKALAPGGRGHKTLEQDMADIVASAKRAMELES